VTPTLVVDGNNVIGAKADGWWRDRPAAARRLLERLQCYRCRTNTPLLLVLDTPHPDLPEGDHDGVEVRYPSRTGRDAADERILELLDERRDQRFAVATSDRALAEAARERGVEVIGAGALLARLDAAGC
jgi:predicted RNA-binding protein with PIN domain